MRTYTQVIDRNQYATVERDRGLRRLQFGLTQHMSWIYVRAHAKPKPNQIPLELQKSVKPVIPLLKLHFDAGHRI